MNVDRLKNTLDTILKNRGTKSLDTLYSELLARIPEETRVYIEK
jgi:hypothetical protein